MFIFIGVQVDAATYQFRWEEGTTYVEVPLGSNIQNYIHIPKANLYKDGVVLSDAEIDYITTGDWLYLLTDVDTTKVGQYQVWYKAVEQKYKPGQCTGYKALVTFDVIDMEKPIFMDYPSMITYSIGSSKPNYESRVWIEDNSGSYDLKIDDSMVEYDRPGTYIVIYKVTDGRNVTTLEVPLQVIDSDGPIITFLGENDHLILSKNSTPSLKDYFKAIDKIDGDVTSSIHYEPFSTEEEKSFPLTVTFYDLNHNETSVVIQIDIIDDSVPLIELYQTNLILDWKDNLEECFKKNIKRALLGKQDISLDISIDVGSLVREVGTYTITYQYQKNGKECTSVCEVTLLSTQAPVILVENITTEPGKRCNIGDYIQVKDESDPQILNMLQYDDSSVDYTKEGTYSVLVTATNSSGLTTSETLYVTVVSPKSSERGNLPYTILFPMLILFGLLIVGCGIYLILKKKKLKS